MFQCLVAARTGFNAETSSEFFAQLYELEELLVAGAIPDATMVTAVHGVSLLMGWHLLATCLNNAGWS